MKNERKQTLLPTYMKSFSCIGSACEDTCCNGWTINIDKNTFKKYKKLSTQKIKVDIERDLKRNKKNSSDGHYAEFRLKSNGCPLQSEEGWCRIQSELGESYLSNTCSIYPRMFNEVDNVVEMGGALSCPEITRLALFNPNGIDFDMTIQEDTSRGFRKYKIDTRIDNYKLFWDIRSFAISILQDRRFNVEERLINLGMWISKLNVVFQTNNIEKLTENINNFKQTLNNSDLKSSLEKIKPNYDLYTKICYEILSIRKLYSIDNKRYLDLLNDISEGLKMDGETLIENFDEIISSIKVQFYNPYFKEKDYILENYLVNDVFINCFGNNPVKIFEQYNLLVLKFALVKLHLYGVSAKYKELNDELVAYVIQSFSKCIEHNVHYPMKIVEVVKTNELNSLAHMAILIKG